MRRPVTRTVALAILLGIAALGAALLVITRSGSEEADAAEWSLAAHAPHRRSYTASAEIGGKIYVAGGMVGETGRPLDLLERYDPATDEWTSLSTAPEEFRAGAGAAFQGRLWALGGKSEDADGHQVYSYDIARDRWIAEPPMPAVRTNLAAVGFRGKLYAIGGLDPLHPAKTVFVYDPGTRRWTNAAPLPYALHAHAAVVFRGEIWVLGGRMRSGKIVRDVWIYSGGRWRAGPDLPAPMETLGVAVSSDSRLDAILESLYYRYDAGTGRWERGPSLRVPRHALAAHTIGDTLFAMGGCIVPQLQDSPVMEKIPVR